MTTRPTSKTPDMTGKASEINDPHLLYERIGYRTFLPYRNNDAPEKLCEATTRRNSSG